MKRSLSLVIPIHNESLQTLQSSLTLLTSYFKSNLKNYTIEIILVENGSSSSLKIPKSKSVKQISIPNRSLGHAIIAGFKKSTTDIIMFYAIDLPFGADIIKSSLIQIEKGYDLVIGSKKHALSKTNIAFDRQLFSFFYNLILKLLFKTQVRDTQGSLTLTRQLYEKIKPRLHGTTPWVQAQIIVESEKLNSKLIEIPVQYTQTRKSKMKYRDAIAIIAETLIHQ